MLVSSADLAGAGVLLLLVNLLGVFLGGLEGSLLFQNLLNGGRNLGKKKEAIQNSTTFFKICALISAIRSQMVLLGLLFFDDNFFPTTLCRGRGWDPRESVELHRPWTFEERSTD